MNKKNISRLLIFIGILIIFIGMLMTINNKRVYTVTYIIDNKKTTQEIRKGSSILKPEAPEKDGYVFVEWQFKNKAFDFASKVNENIDLVAVWESLYTVNLELNDIKKTIEIKNNDLIDNDELISFRKDGYSIEWYKDNKIFDISTEKITDNITLKGKYTSIKTYKIIFDSDGGSKIESQNVKDGNKVVEPSNPKKNGYIFDSWYLDNKKFDFNQRVYTDITLKAKWIEEKPSEKYTVSFNTEGGSRVESQKVTSGQTVKIPPEPTRDGYIFKSWLLNNRDYDFNSKVTSNITLTAFWSKSNLKINKVDTKADKTKITVTTSAVDAVKYEYSINNKNWYEGSKSYVFEKLDSYTNYTVYVKVSDSYGNNKVSKVDVKTLIAPINENDGKIINDWYNIVSNSSTTEVAKNNLKGLRNAVWYAYKNNIKNIYLEKGKYYVYADTDVNNNSIKMYSNINFNLNGATLEVIPNDSYRYNLFTLRNLSNVKIYNGTIIGEKDKHDYSDTSHSETHEYGMGISITNSNDITIQNMNISKFTGDGIYIVDTMESNSNRTKNINILNNDIDNNRRNGISIVAGDHILINGNSIHDTTGAKPGAGIDIERNNRSGDKEQFITNTTISNNRIYGNWREWAFSMHAGISNLKIINNELGDRINIRTARYPGMSFDEIIRTYNFTISGNKVIKGIDSSKIKVNSSNVNSLSAD